MEDTTGKRARVAHARSYLKARVRDRLTRDRITSLLISSCGCPTREAELLAAEYAARQRVSDAGLDPDGVVDQVDRLIFGYAA